MTGVQIGLRHLRAGAAVGRPSETALGLAFPRLKAALQQDRYRRIRVAVLLEVMASETQAVRLRHAGLLVPGSLQQEVVGGSMRTPDIALRPAHGRGAGGGGGGGAGAGGAGGGRRARAGGGRRAPGGG